MPEQDPYSATTAVQSVAAPAPMENPVAISFPLMILTWITFIVVTVILYRVAWKPILRALEQREATIRQSLENAAKLRDELAKLAPGFDWDLYFTTIGVKNPKEVIVATPSFFTALDG